jgi:hypothetical protein
MFMMCFLPVETVRGRSLRRGSAVKALLATSSWPAALPAQFVLFAVVRLASRRGVQAWAQPTSGKKKAGSNE